MSEGDRERFFEALHTLYTTPTARGRERFGPSYKGVEYFIRMHLYGAAQRECDHWHDDAGITTHHIGFTLLFEQALQVVDAAVAIPYWEYTIDDYKCGGGGGGGALRLSRSRGARGSPLSPRI